MKKLIAGLFMAVMVAGSSRAALTASLSMTVTGGKLWANVSLVGIADCPTTGSVTVEWTSPNPVFDSSTYEAPWSSCTQGSGTARTSAYRTVRYITNGKAFKATGVWRVRILAGATVLAEGSFEVK